MTAAQDGLIYIADGRSNFVDRNTGETNRGGQKVFAFMLEDDISALENMLQVLPVREIK